MGQNLKLRTGPGSCRSNCLAVNMPLQVGVRWIFSSYGISPPLSLFQMGEIGIFGEPQLLHAVHVPVVVHQHMPDKDV